jgi:CBS domain-containing membrane protein
MDTDAASWRQELPNALQAWRLRRSEMRMSDKPKTVRDLATKEVATLQRNDALSVADDLMRLGRIRHLVVLDENEQVVGVVSQRDLFRGTLLRALGYGSVAETKLMATIPIKEIMATDLATVAPETPLAEAAELMMQRKIGCLPVLDGDKLVGILTESDFVRYVANHD